MDSYISDRQRVALASGKKDAFAEWTSKHVGSASGFLASIFSNQHRRGNFLSLERSQRKELFITQLLGLQRLRLISATARGFADERGKEVLALEGEKRGISQVLANDCELDDVEKLGLELEALGTRLQGLENEKRKLERRVQALQRRDSERKLIEARREGLNRRTEKSGGEIVQLRIQIAEHDRLLAAREQISDIHERERAVAERIAQIHQQIEKAQQLEIWNSAVECDQADSCGHYKDSGAGAYNANDIIEPCVDDPDRFFRFRSDGTRPITILEPQTRYARTRTSPRISDDRGVGPLNRPGYFWLTAIQNGTGGLQVACLIEN